MAKPHAQTRDGQSQRTADQPPQPDREVEGGAQALEPAFDGPAENSDADLADDWGLAAGKSKMSKETKIGLVLVLVLTTAFGVMVYKRLHPAEPEFASEKKDSSDDDELKGVESSQPGKILAGKPQPDENVPEQSEPGSDPSQQTFNRPDDETSWSRDRDALTQNTDPSQNFEQRTRQFDPATEPDPFASDDRTDSTQQNAPVEDLFGSGTGSDSSTKSDSQTNREWYASDTQQQGGLENSSQPAEIRPLEDGESSGFQERRTDVATGINPDKSQSAAGLFAEPTDAAQSRQADPDESWSTTPGQFEPSTDASQTTDSFETRPRPSEDFREPATATTQQDPFRQDEFRQDDKISGTIEDSRSKSPSPWGDSTNGFDAAPASTDAASRSWETTDTRQQFRQESPLDASSPARETTDFRDGASDTTAIPFATSSSTSVYEIRPGETYWTISKNAYGTARYFRALAVHNRKAIPDPLKMQPGMKIQIPPARLLERSYPELLPKQGRAKAASTVASTPTPRVVRKTAEPAGFFTDDTGRPMYRVGPSDTLSEIAQRHLGRSSRWIQIYHLNRQILKNPDKLQPGLELQLPADASRVEMVRRGSGVRYP